MPSYSWTLLAPAPAAAASTIANALQSALGELDTDYGTDITTWAGPDQTVPDLDPTFTQITGKRVVAEAIARRLCMPHGYLPDDTDAGFDLRQIVNGKWTSGRAFHIKTGIERECMKDPRVYSASVRLEYYASTRTLIFKIGFETFVGSFDLVLAVTSVSVTVLRAA